MEALPMFMSIRQVAKTNILSEYTLRLMEKQGRLPGFYSGRKFLVNYPMLIEFLNAESMGARNGV